MWRKMHKQPHQRTSVLTVHGDCQVMLALRIRKWLKRSRWDSEAHIDSIMIKDEGLMTRQGSWFWPPRLIIVCCSQNTASLCLELGKNIKFGSSSGQIPMNLNRLYMKGLGISELRKFNSAKNSWIWFGPLQKKRWKLTYVREPLPER